MPGVFWCHGEGDVVRREFLKVLDVQVLSKGVPEQARKGPEGDAPGPREEAVRVAAQREKIALVNPGILGQPAGFCSRSRRCDCRYGYMVSSRSAFRMRCRMRVWTSPPPPPAQEALSRVTSFSRRPPRPVAPGSFPPWPGSMSTLRGRDASDKPAVAGAGLPAL